MLDSIELNHFTIYIFKFISSDTPSQFCRYSKFSWVSPFYKHLITAMSLLGKVRLNLEQEKAAHSKLRAYAH